MSDNLVIALDGPAASGKGTLAKKIATQFGLPHLDTGLLYRAVGRGVLDLGKEPGDLAASVEVASRLDLAALDENSLRGAEMGEAASRVAALPEVRVMLLDLQRHFAGQPGGAVLDGRDIGTVICPDAKVKIFVTATPEVRAERRFKELQGRGEAVTYEEVLADIKRRDERDSSRSSAPLVAAADAHLLDTTALDIDAAFRAALDIIGRR
jgi:cytidylate kinase